MDLLYLLNRRRRLRINLQGLVIHQVHPQWDPRCLNIHQAHHRTSLPVSHLRSPRLSRHLSLRRLLHHQFLLNLHLSLRYPRRHRLRQLHQILPRQRHLQHHVQHHVQIQQHKLHHPLFVNGMYLVRDLRLVKGPRLHWLIQMVHAMEIGPARMKTHIMTNSMGPETLSISALATMKRHVLTTEGILGTIHGKCYFK